MADTIDRFERVTNLVTYLLSEPSGVTFAEILANIPGWPEKDEARRRAFERDKRVLRDEGIPLLEEDGTYRIRPEDFYLPDLGLTDDEEVALRLAVAAVPSSGDAGGAAIGKLTLGRAGTGELGPSPLLAELEDEPLLPVLHEAARRRAAVRFRYSTGDELREVEPSLLFFRQGAWYLTGHDRLRGESRNFRIDRIAGDVELLEAGSFEPPTARVTASEAFPRQPWLLGDGIETEEAIVEVDAVMAANAVADVGERATVEHHPDGGVTISMPVANRVAFRGWVLGMLDHAVVRSPPALRDELVAWLEASA